MHGSQNMLLTFISEASSRSSCLLIQSLTTCQYMQNMILQSFHLWIRHPYHIPSCKVLEFLGEEDEKNKNYRLWKHSRKQFFWNDRADIIWWNWLLEKIAHTMEHMLLHLSLGARGLRRYTYCFEYKWMIR